MLLLIVFRFVITFSVCVDGKNGLLKDRSSPCSARSSKPRHEDVFARLASTDLLRQSERRNSGFSQHKLLHSSCCDVGIASHFAHFAQALRSTLFGVVCVPFEISKLGHVGECGAFERLFDWIHVDSVSRCHVVYIYHQADAVESRARVVCLVVGLWTLVERKERRPELALYCTAQALNSLYLQAKKKGYILLELLASCPICC
jgi:hypothetical protein